MIDIPVDVEELADFLGLSPERVRQLRKGGILSTPDKRAGKVSLRDENRRYLDYMRKLADRTSQDVKENRAKLLAVQTLRAEFELEREKGEWVTKEYHVKECTGLLKRFTEFLQQIPHALEQASELSNIQFWEIDRCMREYQNQCIDALAAHGADPEAPFSPDLSRFAKFKIGDLDPGLFLTDPDSLERFVNSMWGGQVGSEQHLIQIEAARWTSYGRAKLPALLHLKKQIEAIGMEVPKDVLDRIAAAEKGHLAPGDLDVVFGVRNIDGTPTAA